ncbi:MAG: hypothetical protein KC549_14640 [Myxococcales bacterium]|nr:hypothetical protein [Myxococcales bacterium]MCB9544690.1 hypothetical protein [Myxococcales bacterium]
MKQENLDDLVAAVLAVNSYSIEKAWALLPKLREAGLTTPVTFPTDLGPATVKLASAGYDRGLLTEMFAKRLLGLMQEAGSGALDELDAFVEADRKDDAVALLVTVPGIGPKVARTAWELLRSGRGAAGAASKS